MKIAALKDFPLFYCIPSFFVDKVGASDPVSHVRIVGSYFRLKFSESSHLDVFVSYVLFPSPAKTALLPSTEDDKSVKRLSVFPSLFLFRAIKAEISYTMEKRRPQYIRAFPPCFQCIVLLRRCP